MRETKRISKVSDVQGLLSNELFPNGSKGLDIDYIHCDGGRFIVFEFLRCQHPKMTPKYSHPKNYWHNWRKFLSLFNISKAIGSDLYLVNYETDPKVPENDMEIKGFGDFAVLKVDLDFAPVKEKPNSLVTKRVFTGSFSQFKEWFKAETSVPNKGLQ